MDRFTVIYDANVLYPAAVRDLLIELASSGLFRAYWTESIHDEWVRSVLDNRPDLDRGVVDRTRKLMDQAVEEPLVTGYEPLIEMLTLPDPDDRHVLAAAIRADADAIVTFNLKDFPAEQLAPFSIEAIHPDEFVRYQFDFSQHAVCEAVRLIRQRLHNPPYDAEGYLTHLAASGLPATAELLQSWRSLI